MQLLSAPSQQRLRTNQYHGRTRHLVSGYKVTTNLNDYIQGLEGGGGVLIPHSRSFFMKIPHPTFFFYRYPAFRAQFWWIPLPGSSQIPNPAPFFSEIPDPVNTLPDPVHKLNRVLQQVDFKKSYKQLFLCWWHSKTLIQFYIKYWRYVKNS